MKERSAAEKLKIVKEAKTRFEAAAAWESKCRISYVEDTKFAEGDSDNNWQWPEEVRQPRETDARPMLTINKTRQHNLDVLNDARQSKVGVKIIPTGGEATYESAQAYMGVVRAIEYKSNADTAYQTALACAVKAGWGYWRILTDYADPESFDKDVVIRRVKDPLLIYNDPDINEFDGSDSRFCFAATDIPKDVFEGRYPKWKGRIRNSSLVPDTWITDDKVRIAEYWRRLENNEQLLGYLNPETGKRAVGLASKLPRRIRKAVIEDPNTITREVSTHTVECFTIIGDEIAEETEWEGIYIPFVRVIGEETVIEGRLDRKGHTRALKDAQRMFNFNCSAFIEHGALQTKVPWTGSAEALEGYEDDYARANKENMGALLWNQFDDEGNKLDGPVRVAPPQGAPMYLDGMNQAAEWMRMVSGQYQADMGAPSNERSGAAITARQRQGDLATYHYLDHQALAIRYTGKILIDLIPKIYDTERVLKYKGDDGQEQEVHIDPRQKAEPGQPPISPVRTEKLDQDTTRTIFNPNVGTYDVEADVGPEFATKRQDAFNAGTQILAQNKELTSIIGDLVIMNADFPGSDEMAQRLKRMVPAQALNEDDNPAMRALQTQLQQAHAVLEHLQQQLQDKTAEQGTKSEKVTIEAYRAQTDRLTSLSKALGLDPQGLLVLVKEVIEEAQATSAGGNALLHIAEPTPDASQIHPDLGGQMQEPAPHAPPLDVNNLIPQPAQPGGQ